MVLQEKVRPPAAPVSGVVILRRAVQIIGELLITAGIVLLLFVAWQLWWTNVASDARQSEVVKNFARELAGPVTPAPVPSPGGSAAASGTADYGAPAVARAPGHGGTIGIMYIPRFGENYTRPIVEGTSGGRAGHPWPGPLRRARAMPGAVGNFAVAGHRQTHGAVLDNIHTLVPGDKIYVQTKRRLLRLRFPEQPDRDAVQR